MTIPRPARLGASGFSRPSAAEVPSDPIELDSGLHGRFAELAAGRVLVIDYLVTRPVPAVPTAELSAHLQRARPRGGVVIASVEGVDCIVEARLETVLRAAGVRIRPVGGAALGQLEVEPLRPLAWLDFLSSVAARRT